MNKRIIEILDNLRQLENCPDDYKKDIESYLSLLNSSNDDIITNGVFDALLISEPRLTADIIWLHNDAIDHDVDISNFKIK
ncbi:hypothetical protein M0Q50_10125, partial [bacterium]|jgi:hypothetical protein|nr:hypothetical protein [bacterium]